MSRPTGTQWLLSAKEEKQLKAMRSGNRKSWMQRTANRLSDSFAEAVNPKKHAIRMAWRRNAGLFSQMQGASMRGALELWKPSGGDANACTLDDLPLVRARSRDAAQNNPLAYVITRFMGDHVVGRGIKPQSRIDADRLGITEDQKQEWEGACEALFARQSDHADVTGQWDFGKLQRLIWESSFTGGDCFPVFPMVRGHGAPLGARIAVIEAEKVSTPLNLFTNPRVHEGVQVDKWGRAEGYWISKGHPGSTGINALDSLKYTFWPKRRGRLKRLNILQVMRPARARQARGVPALAPALPLIDQVAQYIDSTLLAAEVQTRLSFFIRSNADPDALAASIVAEPSTTVDYNKLTQFGAEPGSINLLHDGDEVQTVGSTHPHGFTDQFTVRLLRLIASITGAPYEVLFGDLSGANYSSLRGAFQNFKRVLACEQDLLIPTLKAYWFHVLHEGWLDGQLPPVDFMSAPDEWARSMWIAPALGHVDPTKEIAAFKDAIEGNLMTHAEVISATGGDWEETFEQIAREKEKLAELGMKQEQPAASQEEAKEPDDGDDTNEDPFGTGVGIEEEEDATA